MIKIILLLLSFSASADLITNSGKVYDTGINATWTQDANILNTLESSNGYASTISSILAVNQNGATAGDFAPGGLADWNGAIAFVNYLNSINYNNSNHWQLPFNNQITHLYTIDLKLGNGGIFGNYTEGQNNIFPFINIQSADYWISDVPYFVTYFLTGITNNYYGTKFEKYYVWPIAPGIF